MLTDLVRVANKLDSLGLTNEANILDDLIKMASHSEQSVEEVIHHFQLHPDSWSGVKNDFYNLAYRYDLPDMGVDDVREFYPGWVEKDFEAVYTAIENKMPSVDSSVGVWDLLFLLENHFNPGVQYKMSEPIMEEIIGALEDSLNIKKSDLSEADKEMLKQNTDT